MLPDQWHWIVSTVAQDDIEKYYRIAEEYTHYEIVVAYATILHKNTVKTK